ncbi:intron Large complex component GCFC2-like [Heterodontus francisci]|uniref:intron Large complex component GCFC2-like n=1 Tax=Heterodontus francisci TaxID=7792 RepID=UPI00355C8BDB
MFRKNSKRNFRRRTSESSEEDNQEQESQPPLPAATARSGHSHKRGLNCTSKPTPTADRSASPNSASESWEEVVDAGVEWKNHAQNEPGKYTNQISYNDQSLLSFGDDREDCEEEFKVKKTGNTILFTSHWKKEKQNNVEKDEAIAKDKEILQDSTLTKIQKGSSSEEETVEMHTKNEAGESETSSVFQHKIQPGEIPDARYIQAARKKRQVARAQADFIPLHSLGRDDISVPNLNEEDLINDDELDNHERRIDFTKLLKTQRQRMAEEIGVNESDDESLKGEEEDDDQKLWEQQQIKRVKVFQPPGIETASQPSTLIMSTMLETWKKLPPINLEIVKKRLTIRQQQAFHGIKDPGDGSPALLEMFVNQRLAALQLSSATAEAVVAAAGAPTHLRPRNGAGPRPQVFILFPCLNKFNTDHILKESKKIFEDVHKDFYSVDRILAKFGLWRQKFPHSYYDAYIGLCLQKILNPLIRVQLIGWNPLKPDCLDLAEMSWILALEEFCHMEDEEFKKKENSDATLLSTVIEKTVIPKIEGFVIHVWDPLSSSQTQSLVQICRNLTEEYGVFKDEQSKATQVLRKTIIMRITMSVEEDAFIPLYPKSVLEDQTSIHSQFQERRFWSAVKLLGNILQWDGLLPEQILQDMSLNKLLNRYILLSLQTSPPTLGNLEKCKKIIACFPKHWFENLERQSSIPQLENLCRYLLQSIRIVYENDSMTPDPEDSGRDAIKEMVKMLVAIHALDHTEIIVDECKLEDLEWIFKEN